MLRLRRGRARSGPRALGGRSEQAGILLAAASVPGTFQRTLMDGGAVHQGIATGIVAAINHAIGALVQDLVDVSALRVGGAVASALEWRRHRREVAAGTAALVSAVPP